jgi:methyl-accepting chemotaxis protein
MIEEVSVSASSINEEKGNIINKIESLSSVAQEVSASSEEISASSEQMSASAEEVTSTAQMLTVMTGNMNTEVNKFKLKK